MVELTVKITGKCDGCGLEFEGEVKMDRFRGDDLTCGVRINEVLFNDLGIMSSGKAIKTGERKWNAESLCQTCYGKFLDKERAQWEEWRSEGLVGN